MKYAGKTIIGIAQERGSSAKTKKGAWKYLLNNLPGPTKTRQSSRWDWESWRKARIEKRADGRALILGYDLNDPNTPGRILDAAYAENYLWNNKASGVLKRGNYGEIYIVNMQDRPTIAKHKANAGYYAANEIIEKAVSFRKITASYDSITWDNKRRADGGAMHHELYDFAPGAALVCLRETEGTRYGVKTLSKKYILIEDTPKGIIATPTSEPVAKLAKQGVEYGAIIARIKGDPTAPKLKLALVWNQTYKALAVVDGKLKSIYSGEEYEIGKLKKEKARPGHNGGYYSYPSPQQAYSCEVPGNSKFIDAPRIVVECEVAGRKLRYGDKISSTYLRPIKLHNCLPAQI